MPTADEIYPPGFDSWVEVGQVAQPLEGAARPGHFRGVATVVLKLFELVPADPLILAGRTISRRW